MATRAGARRRRRKFYGETAESVLAALDVYARLLPDDPFDLEEAERRWEALLRGNAAARAALSAALHDLVGQAARRAGLPAVGTRSRKAPRRPSPSGSTRPSGSGRRCWKPEQYPILKIKLGTDRDVEILRTIRDATDKEIRVDANCGWTVEAGHRMLPVLEEFGVTVLEQPLPPQRSRGPCRGHPARARSR